MMEPIIKIMQTQMRTQLEDAVCKAVLDVGVVVDKERLVKALTDAEAFYREGYEAALRGAPPVEAKRDIPQLVVRKGQPRSYGAYRYFCPECGKQQKLSKWGLWYCERCGQALIKEGVVNEAD